MTPAPATAASSGTALERLCPRCGESYFDGQPACPSDGVRLMIVGRRESHRIGEVIDDKYTLLGVLGSGGVGSVYRALQHSMQREVAIKVLHPTYTDDPTVVKRFLKECHIASRLSHPHVVTVFDFGQTNAGELYLVMELLEGMTLRELTAERGRLSPAKAVDIACQMCDALDHAHSQGMIHRDIKPDNVLIQDGVGPSGQFIKVLDFGIAKLSALDTATNLTKTGVVCGTPAYMAPEQALGSEVDATADLYSLGLVLYELLSGMRPFDAQTPVAQLMAQIHDEPMALASHSPGVVVPDALERVIMRTLSKRPGERPASARQLRRYLQDALVAHDTMIGSPPTRPETPAPALTQALPVASASTAGRHTRTLGAIALVLGLSGAVALWLSPGPTALDRQTSPGANAEVVASPAARVLPPRIVRESDATLAPRRVRQQPVQTATAPLSETIELKISPNSATMRYGTETSPAPSELERPDEPVQVTFARAGYVAQTVVLEPSSPETVSVTLVKKATRVGKPHRWKKPARSGLILE